MTLRSAVDLTADLSGYSSVTQVNAIESLGNSDLSLTASGTQDVSVAGVTGAATTSGGNSVTVDQANVAVGTPSARNVTVSGAAGPVDVEVTGAAYTAATATGTLDSVVAVTGGSTINVTQSASSDTSAAAADTTAATITQGAVNVTGGASTTEVNVKQDKAVTANDAVPGDALVPATQEVTFGALATGDSVTIAFDGDAGLERLTFTAKKALTAAEVAAAFANLAKDADQGTASAEQGIYTDLLSTNDWTSGEAVAVSATQSKVTFSNAVNLTPTDGGNTSIVASGDGGVTDSAPTNGTAAVTAESGVMGVANGQVSIDDTAANSIKTITVDGYATGSTIGDTNATEALETLSLKNAQTTATMTVADTAATLALTLEALGSSATVDAVLTFTNAPTTLNVTSTGSNYVNLTAAATKALTVGGTGLLDIDATDLAALETATVTGSAGLKLNGAENDTLTAVDTTGTTGTVTATINGDLATYTGGAGVDNVSVANPGTAISKAISLGAGDDTLDLSAATPAIPTADLAGGEGTDTLVLAAADAVSLSGAATFEGKISGFERLSVEAVAATGTIDLDNLDDINYVVTAGNGGGFDLTLDNMLSGATVELTAASAVGDDTIVSLKDDTGTSDLVNIITSAANGVNVGQVTADKVESIGISTVDKTSGAGVSTNTLTLDADAATSIDVDGSGNLVLTLSASSTEVATVDASAMTGALTLVTLQGDSGATTVTGGSGSDTLTAAGAGDVLVGGAGSDTLKVTTGIATTLTGGAGTDCEGQK
ncbi:hypothetical protein EV688_1291 [Chromatocurvus halotolerans]|uniref:Uncharacterized protein n=1 Tax=Chromatocurvus halotolerans TaxID=1132028 RepID=A0A4R2KIP0_9GAMM|nr:hypothetical protein EV688_1291 [Chromatocurvus halotolerans]